MTGIMRQLTEIIQSLLNKIDTDERVMCRQDISIEQLKAQLLKKEESEK